MPKSSKSDKLEKEKRIRIVQEWILQDHIITDIVTQCGAKWGLSERQAFRYIKEAGEQFKAITEKNLEKRLNYHIQRRNKLLRDLKPEERNTPAGINAQLAILKDIADLEQLYKIKVEHTGKEGAAIQTESKHTVIFENYAAG